MATLYDFSCLARISENLADAVPEVLYGWPFDKATFADLPTWNHGRVKRDAVMVRTLADALEKRADISAMFAPFWIGFHQFVPSGDASAPLFSFVGQSISGVELWTRADVSSQTRRTTRTPMCCSASWVRWRAPMVLRTSRSLSWLKSRAVSPARSTARPPISVSLRRR